VNQTEKTGTDVKILTLLRMEATTLKNRLGLAPMNTGLLNRDGSSNPNFLDFFQQYIESGIGLIYIGGLSVCASGCANKSSFILDDISKCGDLTKIVDSAHKKDARIIFQLQHAGRQANPQEINADIFAPSPIPCSVIGIEPRVLTKAEIDLIIHSFAHSASVAESCGADFIEIHAAHGYLISTFLSPRSNQRNDEYGGSVQNRFRILREIIDETESKSNTPIGIRLNCTDNIDGGISFGDVVWVLSELKKSIAYVSITGGMYSPHQDVIIPSPQMGKALWKSYALRLRRAVSVPIFISGNIDSIHIAEEILNEGASDLVLMARFLLADPYLLLKYLSNRKTEIQNCTYCNECKYHSGGRDYIFCPFNPVLSNIVS